MFRSPVYLFVYGTLQPGFPNAFARLLHAQSRYVGNGTMPGRLFDLGAYPGAVYDPNSPAVVHGAIFALHKNGAILSRLDAYEGVSRPPAPGDEYVRARVPVHYAGANLSCWTYLYNGPVADKPPIKSGRYAG